jgi:hypothetical protein
LSALNDRDALETLVALKKDELQHCTLQLWIPDKSSEEGFYLGTHDHGVALCDLPLSAIGGELLKIVKNACETSKDFSSLSAIRTGFWPIILTACRPLQTARSAAILDSYGVFPAQTLSVPSRETIPL